MLRNIPLYCRLLAKRLLLLIVVYEVTRVIFYIYNHAYFHSLSIGKLIYYMIAGARFDLSAIIMTNLPFIFLSLLPFGREESIYRRIVLKTLFIVTNSICFFLQLGDMVFFPFVYKRSTADIFKFLRLGDDTTNVMPSVIKDYWYLLFIWVGLIYLTYLLYRITERKKRYSFEGQHYVAASFSSYIVLIGGLILGIRGGWQSSPITNFAATEYAPAHDIPLVINSPFSIITTYGVPVLKEYHFFSPEVLPTIYSTQHNPSKGEFRKLNVVTIILESFSKEYIGALNNRHHTNTPFLDSLISQSLVFDNAFSDGKKSIEGIPAVMAGLPSWMDEPFITSDYNKDNITSLSELLNKTGYNTAFFHGGKNGTMGFDSFCKNSGVKHYYGYTEYNNSKDYDGNWGIWDEQFFQYFAKNLDTLHQPFYASIFSLSSHHPFGIPAKYSGKFPRHGEEMEILKCVRYSDMALREFFQAASKMLWYDSTIFVITADHTGPSLDPFYSNRLGMYEIPLIIYRHNSNLKGVSHVTTQHVDILPSILDYLHYPYPFFAFGNSVFDSTNTRKHFAVNYINNVYQIVRGPYCLQMEGKTVAALYNYQKDSMLTSNLMQTKPMVCDSLSTLLEAVMQTYCGDVIHNKMK
jgi:sulfatase-like protein